jgi:hypothetical protein
MATNTGHSPLQVIAALLTHPDATVVNSATVILRSHEDLLDALYRALPFVEEAQTDPHYKTGAAKEVVSLIKASIVQAEEQA